MTPILDIQMRMRELGRIRLGDKGGKGQPQKLEAFRLTSQNRASLDVAAALWGGEVREWKGAPTEGQFELYTKAAVLPIALPPDTEPVSQWYEQWTAGGCTHRCDGVRNTITDEACTCDPDAPKGRACKATTRVNVMLPDLPDIGVWRLETHGWNAAVELPGTLAVIAMARQKGVTLQGRLRIDHRVSKQGGQTHRFVVPVIDLDVTVAQLLEPGGANGGVPPQLPERAGGGESPAPGVISDGQRRRIYAIAKKAGVSDVELKQVILDVTGQESGKGITVLDYAAVIEAVEGLGARDAASVSAALGQGEPMAIAPPAGSPDPASPPAGARVTSGTGNPDEKDGDGERAGLPRNPSPSDLINAMQETFDAEVEG